MTIIAVGIALLLGAGLWRSGPNGLRQFAAFLGGSVVLAGMVSALALPALEGGSKVASAPATLRIRIEGTPGVRFQGSWAVSTLGGSSASANIQGTAPRLYTLSQQGDLGVRIRKLSPQGRLVVEILVDGKVVSKQQSQRSSATLIASYTTNGVSN